MWNHDLYSKSRHVRTDLKNWRTLTLLSSINKSFSQIVLERTRSTLVFLIHLDHKTLFLQKDKHTVKKLDIF